MRPSPAPRIVLTVMVAGDQDDPAVAVRKNELYADGVRRHGAVPVLVDAAASDAERAAAFAAMDGLVLTGGADIHPSRYGQGHAGTREVEHDRDALEAAAWEAAEARGLPVLGICRGFQGINVFSGGTLLQHVDGHAGPGWSRGPAATHPMRIDPTSRVGRLLADGVDATEPWLVVNSYHHQAVRPSDLAPGLRAAAWSESPEGEIVEAFELDGDRFVAGVQCHPERTESTPPEFERLWAAFVAACRGRRG